MWSFLQDNWQGIVATASFVVAIASLVVAIYAVKSSTVMERRICKVLLLSVLSEKHSVLQHSTGVSTDVLAGLSALCRGILDDPDVDRFLADIKFKIDSKAATQPPSTQQQRPPQTPPSPQAPQSRN